MGATEAFPTVSASLGTASPAQAETSLREVASLSRESNSERHFHGELNRTGRMNSSALFQERESAIGGRPGASAAREIGVETELAATG
jgi:hypothetical protein